MMVGKAVGLGFEIISKLDSYFLMTVNVKTRINEKTVFSYHHIFVNR